MPRLVVGERRYAAPVVFDLQAAIMWYLLIGFCQEVALSTTSHFSQYLSKVLSTR